MVDPLEEVTVSDELHRALMAHDGFERRLRVQRSGIPLRLITLLSAMSLAVSACTSEDTLTEPSTEASSARAAGKTYRAVDLGTLGGNFSQAFGISPAGQVVGWSSTAEGDFHAFLWEKGIMTDLGALFGGDGVATGINPAGHVVGHSAGHVFLWS